MQELGHERRLSPLEPSRGRIDSFPLNPLLQLARHPIAQSLNRVRLFNLPHLQHRHRLLGGADLRVGRRAVAGEFQKAPESLRHRPLHLK